MGAIAVWIGSLFTSIGAFVGAHMARKFTMMGIYVAVYISLTVAFALSINTVFLQLVSIAPPGGFFRAGLELMPSGAGNCIAALATAHLASVAYGFWVNLFGIKLRA